MPNSIFFFAVYCCLNNCVSLPSSADEHQSGGVDQVGQVQDEVNGGEHGHGHALIPSAQAQVAAAGGPLLYPAVLRVKLEYGPDNGSRQVEDHGQESVGRQETGEREGEAAGALADAEHDDGRRQDEADAVDGHAVLQGVVVVVQNGVADEDEDDARHEGLTHLQQAGGRGHVTRDFARSRLADAHLAHVGDGGQAGEDGGHDAVVLGRGRTRGTFEEVEGEDYGGGQAEEGGVAGEGDREVLPRHRGSGLEAEELHQDDDDGPGKAKGPAEDAPVSGAFTELPAVHRHGEGHAGEDHGCQTGPQEGAGVQNDGHDVQFLQPLRAGDETARRKERDSEFMQPVTDT